MSLTFVLIVFLSLGPAQADEPANYRRPKNDADLRYWLENMVWHHRFTTAEITDAAGLSADEIKAALNRFNISPATAPKRAADAPLLVLPYPGGRHPRIGFLDGAVRPQRETKVSVFTPWDPASYVVVDVPEAIWSNLGLTYLAHTHVPTIWTKQGVTLEPLEWKREADGTFDIERRLPNGIRFGARIEPRAGEVRMEMWLTNGTKEVLSDLRVQNCVMLKGAAGFNAQTNDNKVFSGPYVACRSADGKRWIITAWSPLHRGWANPPCPCLHSDPKFPDCPPGQTKRLKGWLSFYEGTDLPAELRRIDATGWQNERPLLRLRGQVSDAATGRPLPARVYIQGEDGAWYFPRSESSAGSAVEYRKRRPDNRSVEMHTTLSAHPFVVDVPPGRYTITVEHGKEYRPLTTQVTLDKATVSVPLKLERWVNMPELGWYSGETHAHRTVEELPNAMLAEDLNVAFPLTYWVTEAFVSPRGGPRGPKRDVEAKLVTIDPTHVFYPLNTEYELFTVDRKSHTLGAFFALNQKTILDRGAPPVRDIAERIHREGGLIELDKHNWPWSMALIPVMKVDLFELANNHVWRTEFGLPSFGEPAADYMKIDRDRQGFTERGWLDFGFQNYYALLDCGFRLWPTAGTASGVHPVPLGFGRVYVYVPEGFGYDAWLRGLRQGRSFVTTGPMLLIKCNDQEAGHVFEQGEAGPCDYRIHGVALSEQPLERIDIVLNGQVTRTLKPANRRRPAGGYESPIDEKLSVDSSSWIAVRCFEDRPDKRPRFAHSSPFHITVPGKPLRPRAVEVDYLIKRVEEQITRSAAVLPAAAVDEYREALRVYQELRKNAKE
jgi:hypothetical protein